MTRFLAGLIVGLLCAAVWAWTARRRRLEDDRFEEEELPEKPVPKLDEKEKEKIHEEIESDSNAELARRFLNLAARRRNSHR